MDILEQPGYTKPEAQRGLGLQFLIAFSFGSASLISFSFCRRRLPQIYAARTLRKPGLPRLRTSPLKWILDVLKVTDHEVLRFAGLDAFVYLMFFRAAIAVLWRLSLVSLLFIAPLHWYYLGQIDDDDLTINRNAAKRPNLFGDYVWVYVASTYIFTLICLRTMRYYTSQVVNVRQAYLGHQNSITDRTLRVSGIPKKLRSEQALREYFQTLFGADPESIILCRQWGRLDELFRKRKEIILKLEDHWATYLGPDNPAFSSMLTPLLSEDTRTETNDIIDNENSYCVPESASQRSLDPSLVWSSTENGGIKTIAARMFPNRNRPMGRTKYGGLVGPRVDLIDHFERKLVGIDAEICEERSQAQFRSVTNMAFITFNSVAQCQLAAQSIFSPQPHTMVNCLAPAPNDIIWNNIYLKPKQRSVNNYIISLIVLLTVAFLIYPLTYLARFLDLEIIKKHFPELGSWLAGHKWMAALVTEVLPTYVFTIFNLIVPYFFSWLSRRQGFISKSDVELSTIGKNFFYVFINLFLIFTIESTIFSFSVDKMAKDFARWLIKLSSFYTNLILLQGIGITPFKLLQAGSIFQFPFIATRCRTARDYYDLYKPERINYGLALPTPLFIFIVVLTYSILRRRILLCGLIYFAASYFVFKYQLMYTMVHPQHSNAQLWTVILRRVYLGVAVFHLAMIGLLVLQSEYQFAVLILPLLVLLLGFWYDFERYTRPLLEFVAIEALRQREIDLHNLGTYQPDFAHSESFLDDEESDIMPNQEGSNGSPSSENTLRRRTQSASFLNRAEALTSLSYNGDDSENLSSRLWETRDNHELTLDEDREQELQYVNKSLVAPLDGPWVATSAFDCIVANEIGFRKCPIPQAEWL